VASFAGSARSRNRRVCFFGVEPRFALLVPHHRLLQIGEQPSWDPTAWSRSLGRSVREQVRRARAKGVQTRPLAAAEVERLGGQILALSRRWRSRQQLAPMGFLVGQDLLSSPAQRRWLVAEREGELVALLSMVPVFARRGWLLEDLLRDPKAPNGTAELLVDHAMRLLGAEGCTYATLGLAPLAGQVPGWLRFFRRVNGGLFDFEGLRRFKARLRPHEWTPIFLAFPESTRGWRAVLDSLKAFAGGSLARFAARSLLRAPAVLLRTLAALLFPWMAAMALAPAPWFPSPAIRWMWIGLDAGVALALWQLARRWRDALARALAGVIGLDAALTLLQLLAFNRLMIRTAAQGAVAGVALAAPLTVSALLRAALRRRSGSPERAFLG
jgi:phosphatidylglycerol lysyltransferase